MALLAIIPARLASTRLPRKLLLDLGGKTVLQHTWEGVREVLSRDQILIATDSVEIAKNARRFGAQIYMTGSHECGTDRIAEVAASLGKENDVIINIQADEVALRYNELETIVSTMEEFPLADMATLATPIQDSQQFQNPSCVKVVISSARQALYFSRSPIPHLNDSHRTFPSPVAFLHIGLYAFRQPFLQKFANSPRTILEKQERLEQIRALDLGADFRVGIVQKHIKGIDTQDDYDRLKRIIVGTN